MATITPSEQVVSTRYERICVYGPGKTRKTQLVTSMPRDKKWGKIIYIAADETSEQLPSVLHPEGMFVADPKPKREPGKMVKWDPLTEYVNLATRDWKSEFPDANTVVLDTATQMTEQIMEAYVATGAVQAGHKTLGKPNTLTFHGQPDKGDYGGAQRSCMFIIQYLLDLPMHLVVLFHQHWSEPKEGSLEALVGGPATVGEAQIRVIPGLFDTVLRLSADGKGDVSVHTEPTAVWPAGIRHRRMGQRLGTVKMGDDPRDFWTKHYDPLVAPDPIVIPT